ncbi:type II secretion system F family protein [Gordonia sp. CPCC 205333]|uniref:type II secretion system F family protein n=1 Tax=Gordonia sp. CPCC 205333 TaxID=3140790 RepID=UPI003AF34459
MLIMVLAGALALWVWPPPRWWLYRVIEYRSATHEPRWIGVSRSRVDPFEIAAAYDLFAICLRAGLPVRTAGLAVVRGLPPSLATSLRRSVDLLGLGADADQAWYELERETEGFGELAVLARRSARAGSSMSAGLADLSARARERAADSALAAAERAGVKISGPLGLCFLPAFVCLGIAPVVIGLAGTVLGGL